MLQPLHHPVDYNSHRPWPWVLLAEAGGGWSPATGREHSFDLHTFICTRGLTLNLAGSCHRIQKGNVVEWRNRSLTSSPCWLSFSFTSFPSQCHAFRQRKRRCCKLPRFLHRQPGQQPQHMPLSWHAACCSPPPHIALRRLLTRDWGGGGWPQYLRLSITCSGKYPLCVEKGNHK